MVQYSFTSTETRRLVRTDSSGRSPRLSHSLLNYGGVPSVDQRPLDGLWCGRCVCVCERVSGVQRRRIRRVSHYGGVVRHVTSAERGFGAGVPVCVTETTVTVYHTQYVSVLGVRRQRHGHTDYVSVSLSGQSNHCRVSVSVCACVTDLACVSVCECVCECQSVCVCVGGGGQCV